MSWPDAVMVCVGVFCLTLLLCVSMATSERKADREQRALTCPRPAVHNADERAAYQLGRRDGPA